jgi:hypothetical protein
MVSHRSSIAVSPSASFRVMSISFIDQSINSYVYVQEVRTMQYSQLKPLEKINILDKHRYC